MADKDTSQLEGEETQPEEAQDAMVSEKETTSGVSVETEYFAVEGGKVAFGSGDITNIHIHVDSANRAKSVLDYVDEAKRGRNIPRVQPPSSDDPLWEQIEYWFENELTTEPQKFYAITLGMFNGLKYPDFKNVYELVLKTMGIESEKAEEDRNSLSRLGGSTHEDKLIALVRAELKPSRDSLEQILAFQDEGYVTTLFDLLRRRYPSVLLDLLPVLKQLVERYRYWDIRSRAALAVAEISQIGFHQVRVQALEPWASSRYDYVRASVGYPLAWLAEDKVTRAGVRNLLNDWANGNWTGPGEAWRYRWAAASTYRQIGALEIDDATWPIDWACQGLTQLAGFNDIRIADAVIHSLVALSLQGHLERILLTIKLWIEGGSAKDKDNFIPQTRCIVGILAFMGLSEIHIGSVSEDWKDALQAGMEVGNLFELIRQSGTEKSAYWQLMVMVGVRSFEYKFGNRSLVQRGRNTSPVRRPTVVR